MTAFDLEYRPTRTSHATIGSVFENAARTVIWRGSRGEPLALGCKELTT